MGLSAADRAMLQQAQERARARMSGRTIDETGRDVARLSNLLTISDLAPTMTGNGGRQDATQSQGQDGRAAAVPPPGAPYGSRDSYSCGGITEGVGMGRGFRIEVVSTSADSHHWRIKGGNGEIICHSETYTTRSAAMQTLDSFAAWIGGLVAASVQFVDAEVPEL